MQILKKIFGREIFHKLSLNSEEKIRNACRIVMLIGYYSKIHNPWPLPVLSLSWLHYRICYVTVHAGQMPPIFFCVTCILGLLSSYLIKQQGFLLPCPVVCVAQL